MRISAVTIAGFRSFGSRIKFDINEKLSVFIGHNSSGKTAALDALRKVFGFTSERELFREDFHIPKGETTEPSSRNLSIEVQFRFSEDDPDSIPHFFKDMVVDSNGASPYLRIRLESSWTASAIHRDGDVETKLYFITVPEGATESDDSKRIFPNHLRQLVQIIYVPAIRRPGDQIKYASGSMLYRVLRKVKWDDDFKQTFEEKIKEIEDLFSGLDEFSTIQDSINSFWTQFHKDERYKQSKLGFGQSDLESVLKRMEVSFSPSGTHRPYKVEELGEGYRSLFYLTLVCSLLEVEEKLSRDDEDIGITRPLITLLEIEEPENHIAPQLLGRTITILKKLSVSASAQVFVSSHTPAIIKRVNPESICHFRIKDIFETEVNTIVLPPQEDQAYKFVKEAVQNFPEMYFAKLVVIGEGDSETVLIGKLMHAFDVDFDDHLVTFAPLGHRFVHHIWKLLRNLKIPFVTLLDLDLEREGGGWGRIHYAISQLLDIGVSRKNLLEVDNVRVLSPEEFDEMSAWLNDEKVMAGWIQMLEKYHIYFSYPLDLDYMMLEQFPDAYKSTAPGTRGGPRIPDKSKERTAFDEKVKAAVHATLKSIHAKANMYTQDQKELMIWYSYLFLGRGKPVTHILALSKLNEHDLVTKIPPVFKRLFDYIKKTVK